MKRNIRYTIFFAVLPALFALFILGSCKKASDSATPSTNQEGFYLKGSVINAVTHTGIANARVYFGTQPVITTDAEGNYKVNCKVTGNGNFDVRVLADGYGYGFTSAIVGTNAAMVSAVMLEPLAAAVSVGSAGATLNVNDPESLASGSQDALVIPTGALADNTMVSFTRFTGNQVPGYAPSGLLNLCVVNLSPANIVPAKPVQMKFALPFADASLTSLPLMKFNFESNTWEMINGVAATINHTDNTATVEVSSFGTYSLGIVGNFSETAGASGTPTVVKLDPTQSSVDFTYLATNEYPAGTPGTISLVYLRNLASQNTRLQGIRVSFEDNTVYTYNYIGSRPDSLAPVKSTNTGYYRWVPKVSYAPQQFPMTTMIHGISTSGIISKQVYSPLTGWEYIHDQGGGGK